MKLLLAILFATLSAVCSVPVLDKAPAGGRIIGGQDARAGQFPFATAIYYRTSDGTYFCSGSLVTRQWVLTAGRCVDQVVSFTLHFGAIALNDTNRVTASANEYVLHPFYDPITFVGDVGLIMLRMPIDYSDYIQQAYLPGHPLEDGAAVTSIGWGQTSDDQANISNELKYVAVVSIPNTECQKIYTTTITDDMVCVEGNSNEGTCNGDLGGPLVRFQPRAPTLVVGVSSFVGPAGCESTQPSGYTRIYPYVSWIRETTQSG